MSDQDTLTSEPTLRHDTPGSFMAKEIPAAKRRHTFSDFGDFKTYLCEMLGAKVEGDGIRGKMSRRGALTRRAAEGGQQGTLGDPVLDAIASPDGKLVIGDETIDLRQGVAFAAPDLTHTGDVNGAERWASDDGSLVEYRLGTGRLFFHAWKKHTFYGYWSIGAEISVSETPAKFQAAQIESRYFMSVTAPCEVVKVDSDSDRNDTYVDEYEWGWNSPQPERVASACRALWHNAFFADVVTAGDGCEAAANNIPWDQGEPAGWQPINTVLNLNGDWTDGSTRNATISRDLEDLTVNMSAFNRPTAHGSITGFDTISVSFPDDTTYTGHLEAPNRIRWSNNSVWTKVINTVIDLNGRWTDGGARSAVIFEGAQTIKVDMSDYDRSNATGSILDASNISVKFPDDQSYTAQLQTPNKIQWSNGSTWTKKP